MSYFGFFSNFLHVSGQLLPFNGQPDLLSHLRDHSAIFPGFGDNFDTLGMSLDHHIKPYYGPHNSLRLIRRVSKSSPKPAKIVE